VIGGRRGYHHRVERQRIYFVERHRLDAVGLCQEFCALEATVGNHDPRDRRVRKEVFDTYLAHSSCTVDEYLHKKEPNSSSDLFSM